MTGDRQYAGFGNRRAFAHRWLVGAYDCRMTGLGGEAWRQKPIIACGVLKVEGLGLTFTFWGIKSG